jgi:hypothetical protein
MSFKHTCEESADDGRLPLVSVSPEQSYIALAPLYEHQKKKTNTSDPLLTLAVARVAMWTDTKKKSIYQLQVCCH